ncbi:L1 [Serinus canaria papillomavirus 1]|uniref:L1 n=1 Tax=Serinus canaria papillomavirus 1 TaxID=2094713 RepID=UPI000D0C0C8D|nr:L1 [Serinus canaria papillomavirus 1]AVH76295.1 L1 [Serinus canaria papillomavirus 1]
MTAAAVPRLIIPSTTSVPTPYSTDEYVTGLDYYYHLHTDRLLTVGNPYFEVADTDKGGVAVPKVSANQYRCFRILLPDPNGTFQLPETNLYDPEKHRLVWQVKGVQVNRGQPVGVGLAAAPAFNRGRDAEQNSRAYVNGPDNDDRISCAFDPKQNQMMIVGCAPAIGEHWGKAEHCAGDTLDTKCPAIQLVNTHIQDGDMSDIGFGAMDFTDLGVNQSDVPLELWSSAAKYPDWIKMHTDSYGDSCFYHVTREQVYARRYWQRSGKAGEPIPNTFQILQNYNGNNSAYLAVPSGSVVTSDTNIFNRPYWLSRAQGPNNGVCWLQNLFITVLDNSRNVIMHVSSKAEGAAENADSVYVPNNYYESARHVEEYEISVIVQLCRVTLSSEILGHLYRMNPHVLKQWGIQEAPSTVVTSEDRYRWITSQATKCPLPAPEAKPVVDDPYKGETYWTVDAGDRLSSDLGRFPLGRKFLQLPRRAPAATKRAAVSSSVTAAAKRRRKK